MHKPALSKPVPYLPPPHQKMIQCKTSLVLRLYTENYKTLKKLKI